MVGRARDLDQPAGVVFAGPEGALRVDSEFILSREQLDGSPEPVLVVMPALDQPSPRSLERLTHEYALKEALEPGWAAVPRALLNRHGRRLLILADPGGTPLDRLLGQPLDLATFLRLAGGMATALGELHRRGLIHKDVRPANFLVDPAHLSLLGPVRDGFLSEARPASTLVVVQALAKPAWLYEVEATAFRPDAE